MQYINIYNIYKYRQYITQKDTININKINPLSNVHLMQYKKDMAYNI